MRCQLSAKALNDELGTFQSRIRFVRKWANQPSTWKPLSALDHRGSPFTLLAASLWVVASLLLHASSITPTKCIECQSGCCSSEGVVIVHRSSRVKKWRPSREGAFHLSFWLVLRFQKKWGLTFFFLCFILRGYGGTRDRKEEKKCGRHWSNAFWEDYSPSVTVYECPFATPARPSSVVCVCVWVWGWSKAWLRVPSVINWSSRHVFIYGRGARSE